MSTDATISNNPSCSGPAWSYHNHKYFANLYLLYFQCGLNLYLNTEYKSLYTDCETFSCPHVLTVDSDCVFFIHLNSECVV